MGFEVIGVIQSFGELSQGTTKKGDAWKKQEFVVKTSDEYNNLYCFELFAVGDKIDRVDNLTKYNKVGDTVKVEFNVNTNEYKGKFYTSLSAWMVDNEANERKNVSAEETEEFDLF